MYLKSIDIHGFKSFANRIDFQFHSGITGIVGPNGSGKSNVADAVRWVLGEQSLKQLRGASSQDVIFAGTEARKPLSYANVSITFDNSDFQLMPEFKEVTVARCVYRSGKSEYLLNGTACRLKDISELFYDTGIGKEGYSIIGQSQIEKILSGKPEERRELFDEAAGIVKFKHRKESAQKKLAEEKQNRLRISDIISVLEEQKEPLEAQAEVAKIYLRKKEELKDLDVNIFLREHNRLSEQIQTVSEKHALADGDLLETTKKHEQTKIEYEQLEERLGLLEEAIQRGRDAITDGDVLREKLSGEINVLQEQIKSSHSNEENLNQRLKTAQAEIELKNSDLEGLQAEQQKLDSEAAASEKSRDEARERLKEVQARSGELNKQIEESRHAIIEALNQRAAIKTQIGSYDTMLEQSQLRQTELSTRFKQIKSDEKEQEAEIAKQQEEFTAIGKELEELNASQNEIDEKLAGLREELAHKDRQMRDTQAEYHQEKSRLETLSNLSERYEGYGGAIKRVMEQKGKEKGLIGVVADIIKVEKKYETAIEIALGGNLQNIVTKDEATAKRMIALLKEEKAGRATFLPLTNIVNISEFKHQNALTEEGVLGRADQLVETAPEYAAIAQSLLGRIIVVDHINHATQISAKYGREIRIVTLEGEYLSPGGAISGGSFKNSSNLLSRHRETLEAEKKIAQYLKTIAELTQGIEDTKTKRNALRLELEETKSKSQEKFIEQTTARLNVDKATEKKEAAGLDSINLVSEEKEIIEQIKEIKAAKEAIAAELAASEELEKRLEKEIVIMQNELEDGRDEETLRQAAVREQDIEAEKILQQQGFGRQNIERLSNEIKRLQTELAELQAGLLQSREAVELKQKSIAEIEKTILASHSSQSDTERRLQEDIAIREKMTAKQKNFFNERESLAGRIAALDKEVYRLATQKERLQESVTAQINYMWEEYEITLSDAIARQKEHEEQSEKPAEVGAMKRRIATIKEEIKGLGDVNVNAIEDFRQLMERYNFLSEQHRDLEEAERVLDDIIAELDAAMRQQFDEKFAEINQEFDRVFKELYGGGKGTLELMDEGDILETGIRIIAQPPGKKLQNMMQLSGGEKALTAIALIFAIQNLKPSPFCLLDEIEAALDENNVGRFARYLQRLAKTTQFIVITHRRGTMEKADHLYGITMQEKGISALVSVKLVEKDLED